MMKYYTDRYMIIKCSINGKIQILKFTVADTYQSSDAVLRDLLKKYENDKFYLISVHWEC